MIYGIKIPVKSDFTKYNTFPEKLNDIVSLGWFHQCESENGRKTKHRFINPKNQNKTKRPHLTLPPNQGF